MNRKNASPPRQQDSSQNAADHGVVDIVADGAAEVKPGNAIRSLRLERHIPASDMVAVVRTLYPGYDKPLHSKVDNGDKYGIRLRADAEKLLLHHFAENDRKRRKGVHRKKPKRIQARVSEQVYGVLQRITEQSGQTMQEFLEGLILKYISEDKSHE